MSIIRVHLVGSVPIASILQPISVAQQTSCVILRRQLRPHGRFRGSFRGSELGVCDRADSPRGCPEGPEDECVVGGKKEELAQRRIGGGRRHVRNRGRDVGERLTMRAWREFHLEVGGKRKREEREGIVQSEEEESVRELAGKTTGGRARSGSRARERAIGRRERGGRRTGRWREGETAVCDKRGKKVRQRETVEGVPGVGGERVALQLQRVVEEEDIVVLQSHRQNRRGRVEKALQGSRQLELVVLEEERGRGGRERVGEDVAVVDEAEYVR